MSSSSLIHTVLRVHFIINIHHLSTTVTHALRHAQCGAVQSNIVRIPFLASAGVFRGLLDSCAGMAKELATNMEGDMQQL